MAKTVSKADVAKLDKKALRAMADKLGVEWSKQKDTEDTLRKKIEKALAKNTPKAEKAVEEEEAKEATGTAFDLKARAPVGDVTDPKTGKITKQPLDCFGWFYEKGNKRCDKDCPHRAQCAKLAEGAKKAIEELQAQAEAEDTGEQEAEETVEAQNGRAAKAEKKANKKGGKMAQEGVIEEKTALSVLFDEEFIDLLDDDDLRKFYRRVFKKAQANDGKISAGGVVDLFGAIYEVEDREATINSLVKTMIDNAELARAK